MKILAMFARFAPLLASMTVALALVGCASSGTKGTVAPPQPSRFTATDGRTIEIGKATTSEGGRSFKDPHLEKCWIADGFDFTGYDTLFIAPTLSGAKIQEDEQPQHRLAQEKLPAELAQLLAPKAIFTNIITRESELKPGVPTLKLENTIVDYSKGSRAGRYFVGLYGGGQPVLRVQGKMTEGDKTLFTYQVHRSGTSAGARMGGVFKSGDEIQIEDIHSMTLDLTDFMSAIAGKYTPQN